MPKPFNEDKKDSSRVELILSRTPADGHSLYLVFHVKYAQFIQEDKEDPKSSGIVKNAY